ncbi:MAG TPA: ATP-binding cassette domain-containing protein [Methanospirillum sp.]|uniref:ATP-binding cassette domain-containing protein n=1 Tax=Methanospirillum sp. TaxID=45200 RepID=UPI002C81B4F9|nr:ATP-binding cassette domain-containing protein [Methanospirillum sp.]HWQ64112.1 ATP-binding cassette domain-containing protein [Methanospirillum sp.]
MTGTARIPGSNHTHDQEETMIIRIEHLSKIFGGKREVRAVDDVSCSIMTGEIFGLLGPNGAGKSTLIRILTTLLTPSSGTAFIGPYDVTKDPEAVRRIIGVCPQNGTLDLDLTAFENLSFYGRLQGIGDAVLRERINELLEMAHLKDRAHTPVQTFSGGMRRKLEIVRAFIHHPLILFLDEPTIGLDPDSRRQVWQQITLLNQEHTTVILTTHYMDEAEKLCNRIAFVEGGRLVALDTPEKLKQSLPAGDLIGISTGSIIPEQETLTTLRNLPGVISVSTNGSNLQIAAKGGSTLLPAIIGIIEGAALPITSVTIRSPSLEDVFIELTGRYLDTTDSGTGRLHS